MERTWHDTTHIAKNKSKCKEVKIDVPPIAPEQVEPIIEKASQKELPSILMKTTVTLDNESDRWHPNSYPL